VFAGAAAGVAVLGGYQSIFLFAAFIAGALLHPARWTYLRSPSPWISAVAGALVVAPHVWWLYRNGFAPLSEVVARHTGAPFGEVLAAAATYVGVGLAGIAVPVALYWLAVRPDRATLRQALWPSDPDGRLLAVVFVVPLVLRALLAPIAGTVLPSEGTAPAWFLLPILLLRPAAAHATRTAAIRVAALVLALTIAALIAAPWLASYYHKEGTPEGREYYRQVSADVTRDWHSSVGRLLRIVVGDPHLTAAISFYSTDRPDAVPDFDFKGLPWVSEERLDGEGFVAVCRAEDMACVDEARQRAAGKVGTQFINFQTRNLYQGTPGNPGRFFFLLVPPQPIVRVPK
jgi:hypothetical protein